MAEAYEFKDDDVIAPETYGQSGHPHEAFAWLRKNDPPVVARIERDLLCLDPRTVLPEQEPTLIAAVLACLQELGAVID